MLSSIRVLDLSDEAGFLAGKILGDLGADVVKVEPPGGDRAGRRPPYLAGVADPERSLAWLALNTSKRGVTLDLESNAGRGVLHRLLGAADVLLDTFAPGTLEAWGFGWDAVSQQHPRLVRCAITPFGQTGPHSQLRARDLVVVAMGGNASMTGDPDRPPLRCTLPTSYYHAAPEAVLGALMALQAREATGRGQLVDVSLHECQLATLLGGPGVYAASAHAPRRSGARSGRTRAIWPARDGHVSFGLDGGAARVPGLRALVAWMAECDAAPEWLRGYDWDRFAPNALDADAHPARLREERGVFDRRAELRVFEGGEERAVAELRMREDLARVVARREQDASFEGAVVEFAHRLAREERAEDSLESGEFRVVQTGRVETFPVVVAQPRGRRAGFVHPCDQRTRSGHARRAAAQAERDVPVARGPDFARATGACAAATRPLRRTPVEARCAEQRTELALVQRHVDELAALRCLARVQGHQHAEHRFGCGVVVRGRQRAAQRRAIGIPRQRRVAPHRHHHQIARAERRVRSRLPERRDRAAHQTRVLALQRVPAEPPLFERARCEGVEQHVGLVQQALQQGAPRGRLGVERDAALAGVEREPREAALGIAYAA